MDRAYGDILGLRVKRPEKVGADGDEEEPQERA